MKLSRRKLLAGTAVVATGVPLIAESAVSIPEPVYSKQDLDDNLAARILLIVRDKLRGLYGCSNRDKGTILFVAEDHGSAPAEPMEYVVSHHSRSPIQLKTWAESSFWLPDKTPSDDLIEGYSTPACTALYARIVSDLLALRHDEKCEVPIWVSRVNRKQVPVHYAVNGKPPLRSSVFGFLGGPDPLIRCTTIREAGDSAMQVTIDCLYGVGKIPCSECSPYLTAAGLWIHPALLKV